MSTTAVLPVAFASVASSSSAFLPTPDHKESPMRTTVTALRTFVLAFLILAGSLGAAILGPAHDVAAAGPCTVTSSVKTGVSSGRYFLYGQGVANCSSNGNQTLTVRLYANGYYQSGRTLSSYTYYMYANTPSIWAYACGTRYQTLTTHSFNGYTTNTWSPGFFLC